jgi:signal transduction histidine kinase
MVRDKYMAAFFLLYAVAAILVGLSLDRSNNAPQANQGVLDLTHWDWRQDGMVKLNGEWEFYPNQLLTPQNFTETKHTPARFIQVPSVWNGVSTDDGQPMGAWGYATYRLTLKLNPATDVPSLALRTLAIRSSNRIYINGELRSSLGQPNTSKQTYEPQNYRQIVPFDAPGDRVEIVIQAANYDYMNGGIALPIYLGESQDTAQKGNLVGGIEIALALMLLLFGLFYLILYLNVRRDRSFLIFGLFFLFFTLVMLLNGEKMAMQLLPELPYHFIWKVKDFSEYATALLYSVFSRSMYNSWKVRHMFTIPIVLYGAFCLVIVVLPYDVYIHALTYFYASIPVCYCFVLIVLLREYAKGNYGGFGQPGLRLYLMATSFLILLLVDDVFYYYTGLTESNAMGYFSIFVFVLLIAFMLAQNYFQTYAALERSTLQLRAANQSKDDFLLRTSHELNTPLHGIINLSQAMLDEASKASVTRRSDSRPLLIRNIAFRMSNMVNDIIDLSRMKDGHLEMRLTGVDLATCVSVVFEVFAFLAKGKDVRLSNRIQSSARYALADENRLTQVLYNLIDNSMEHTERGSIIVSSRLVGDRVTIAVEDTGTGIAPEHRETIFQPPHVRGDSDQGASGFGLGLSVAKELVERMGGTLILRRSELHSGSCFELSLPAQTVATEQAAATLSQAERAYPEGRLSPDLEGLAARNEANKNALTVLIVDDEMLQIELLSNILAVEGYRVITARSSEEALSLIHGAVKPDIMLLDVLMAGGSGYDVSREIRKLYSPIDLPILFIAVRNTPADIEAGLTAGGNDFITKPFDAGEVRIRIRTLLALKRLAKEAATNEMAFLRSQIKPHFLYNALGTIMSLCYTDGQRAGELLTLFSKYLRIIFHLDNTEETVALRQEVELVKVYVELEKARFGERIQVEFEMDESLLDGKITLLTIQPLVENAIRHGVARKISGGKVRLTIGRQDELICIQVEDDGVGMTDLQVRDILARSANAQGVGFANITRRMIHLTGEPPIVESEPGRGTRVTLRLPYIPHSSKQQGEDQE